MKHNKKRNISLLLEFLKHDISESIINNDFSRAKQGYKIIRKYISNSLLRQEKKLSDIVVNTFMTENIDDSSKLQILEESYSEYSKLDQNKLEKLKDKLIKEINYSLGKVVYDIKVNNYKLHALVNSIWRTKNKVERTQYLGLIKDEIDKMKNKKEVKSEPDEKINKLSLRIITEKQNKIIEQLLPEQKIVLKEFTDYVYGNKSENSFGSYLKNLKEELIIKMAILKENNNLIKEDTTKNNFDKVIKILANKNSCPCRGNIEDTIKYIMEIQDFLDETQKLKERKNEKVI